MSNHVTDVYSLAQGPLHLARETREEKRGNGLDKSGMWTSLNFVFVFVSLAACCAF